MKYDSMMIINNNEVNNTFFSMDCMRGKSIEPASLALVAREVKLRREIAVNNNLSCLGRPRLWRRREVCDVDLRSDIRLNLEAVGRKVEW